MPMQPQGRRILSNAYKKSDKPASDDTLAKWNGEFLGCLLLRPSVAVNTFKVMPVSGGEKRLLRMAQPPKFGGYV